MGALEVSTVLLVCVDPVALTVAPGTITTPDLDGNRKYRVSTCHQQYGRPFLCTFVPVGSMRKLHSWGVKQRLITKDNI